MELPYILIKEVLTNGWRAILLLGREEGVRPVRGSPVRLIGN
jgi:hypothetical protein